MGPAVRLSIFLSPARRARESRARSAGIVRDVEYVPGRFLAAYRPEASEQNERCTVAPRGGRGAGGGAPDRRACWPGASCAGCGRATSSLAGERYGLIRFGSRTDLVRAAGHGGAGAGGRPRAGRGNRHGGAAMRDGHEATARFRAVTAAAEGAAAAPLAGAARAAPPRDLPAAEPAHDRQPLLRLPRPHPHRAAALHGGGGGGVRGHGDGHAGRQGGAPHQDHQPVRRGVRLARRRRLVLRGARLHALHRWRWRRWAARPGSAPSSS